MGDPWFMLVFIALFSVLIMIGIGIGSAMHDAYHRLIGAWHRWRLDADHRRTLDRVKRDLWRQWKI